MKTEVYWYQNRSDKIGGTQISNYYWKKALEDSKFRLLRWNGKDDKIIIASNYSRLYRNVNPSQLIILQHTTHPKPIAVELLRKVRLVIAMSEESANRLRAEGINAVAVSPYVSRAFKPLGLKRKGLVHFGRIAEDKGIEETLEVVNEPIDFYGSIDSRYRKMIDKHKFATYKGMIDNLLLPRLLNRYETFFWRLPRYGGYGRNIVESALCGLKIDVNRENFGIFKTLDLDNSQVLRNQIENEYDRFTQIIQENI